METAKQGISNTAAQTGWRNWLAYVAWLIAFVSMVGSLFFSEGMQLPPCILCWYQRIAMYPLVLIIACGIVMRDQRMRYYALPVCLVGMAVAFYHNLLYYGIIPENLSPCVQGISCTLRQIEWLGFISIPLLSLAAFIVIAVCLVFARLKGD